MPIAERLHAKRLVEHLESDNPCGGCPHVSGRQGPWDTTCIVCQAFIGLTTVSDLKGHPPFMPRCPCHRLKEPIKDSWIVLEEKGYV